MSHPVVPEHRLMVHRLAEKWKDRHDAPSMPPEKTWRGSYAGKCARQIQHMINADEQSNPTDLAGHWVMGLGSSVHELLGPSIQAWASESTIEIFEVIFGTRGNDNIRFCFEDPVISWGLLGHELFKEGILSCGTLLNGTTNSSANGVTN